jgi:hypothetical protein
VFPKDSEAPPGGVDDMTKLSYLHEPGVLQNLAARYELNEIYVSYFTYLSFMTCQYAEATAPKERKIFKMCF